MNGDKENLILWLEDLAMRALTEFDDLPVSSLEKSSRIIRYLERLREPGQV